MGKYFIYIILIFIFMLVSNILTRKKRKEIYYGRKTFFYLKGNKIKKILMKILKLYINIHFLFSFIFNIHFNIHFYSFNI